MRLENFVGVYPLSRWIAIQNTIRHFGSDVRAINDGIAILVYTSGRYLYDQEKIRKYILR